MAKFHESEVPKHRSSKDTKRWCKGVPGREHEILWTAGRTYDEPRFYGPVFFRACTKCRRQFGLGIYRGGFHRRINGQYQYIPTLGPAFGGTLRRDWGPPVEWPSWVKDGSR